MKFLTNLRIYALAFPRALCTAWGAYQDLVRWEKNQRYLARQYPFAVK